MEDKKMKKYIKPVTEELILDVQAPMLDAASIAMPLSEETVDEGTAGESRRSSIWDDDEY